MVRNYKKKTDRIFIDEDQFRKAISDVLNKLETPTTAAIKYHIKRTTLNSRLKKLQSISCSRSANDQNCADDSGHLSEIEIPEGVYQSKFTSKQIFTASEESELTEYIKKCSQLQHGLTYNSTRKFAYEFAQINKKTFPEKWHENQMAGLDWIQGFLKRNNTLSLRKPESSSLARSTGFNKLAVDEFYKNLSDLMEQHKFDPKNIYNLDESGVNTVMDTPKVILFLMNIYIYISDNKHSQIYCFI